MGEFLKFMSDNGNSITKTYDLLKWLLPIISRFPKDKRYTLGQRLEKKLLDILELLLCANYMDDLVVFGSDKTRLTEVKGLVRKKLIEIKLAMLILTT